MSTCLLVAVEVEGTAPESYPRSGGEKLTKVVPYTCPDCGFSDEFQIDVYQQTFEATEANQRGAARVGADARTLLIRWRGPRVSSRRAASHCISR